MMFDKRIVFIIGGVLGMGLEVVKLLFLDVWIVYILDMNEMNG